MLNIKGIKQDIIIYTDIDEMLDEIGIDELSSLIIHSEEKVGIFLKRPITVQETLDISSALSRILDIIDNPKEVK